MSQNNENHLNLRAVSTGIIGAVLISASSFYIALKFSFLYLPTVTVTFLAITVLKLLGKKSNSEAVVAHSIMNAGFTVATGVAFTMPGFLILRGRLATIDKTLFLITMIVGSFIGTLLSFILRKEILEERKLEFPMHEASHTIIKSKDNEKNNKILTAGVTISAVIAFFRDFSFSARKGSAIPEIYSFRNSFWNFYVSPLLLGLGYILGFANTFFWFLGGLITIVVARPLVFYYKYNATHFSSMKNSFIIGFIIGIGCSLITKILSIRKKEDSDDTVDIPMLILVLSFFSVWIISYFYKLPIFMSIIFMATCILCSVTASFVTGKTGINPMEIYGIFTIVIIIFFNRLLGGLKISSGRYLTNLNSTTVFFLVCIAVITCGLTVSLLNDFKLGSKVGIVPWQQFVAELIGAVTASFVIWFLFFVFFGFYRNINSSNELELLKPTLISSFMISFPFSHIFWIGGIIGFVLNLFKLPVFYIGIGIYSPFSITIPVFVGGVIHFVCKKISNKFFSDVLVLVSGLMTGEALIGILIAIINYIKIFM